MRYVYKGTGDILHGPDGEQVPPRDLSDEEGKLYRAIIAANEKITGTKLYEAIHEEPTTKEPKGSASP